MKIAKRIVLPAMYTALLIGGQIALSGVSGVEIVTVLLLTFCFRFGILQGLIVATGFSLLRNFYFGFYPTVVLLYMIYFNLFAIVFGALGHLFGKKYSIKSHVVLIVTAVLMTVLFTAIDNVITPLFFGMNPNQTKAYWVGSLSAVIPQSICACITTIFLFPVVLKVFNSIDFGF